MSLRAMILMTVKWKCLSLEFLRVTILYESESSSDTYTCTEKISTNSLGHATLHSGRVASHFLSKGILAKCFDIFQYFIFCVLTMVSFAIPTQKTTCCFGNIHMWMLLIIKLLNSGLDLNWAQLSTVTTLTAHCTYMVYADRPNTGHFIMLQRVE